MGLGGACSSSRPLELAGGLLRQMIVKMDSMDSIWEGIQASRRRNGEEVRVLYYLEHSMGKLHPRGTSCMMCKRPTSCTSLRTLPSRNPRIPICLAPCINETKQRFRTRESRHLGGPSELPMSRIHLQLWAIRVQMNNSHCLKIASILKT